MIRYVLSKGMTYTFIACDKCKSPLHCATAKNPMPNSRVGMAILELDGQVHYYCKKFENNGNGCDPGSPEGSEGWDELEQSLLQVLINSRFDLKRAEETKGMLDQIDWLDGR